tara:strand:+ start:13904 stop:14167 length:264 start_codon:yes stop_codon:yes gene_type:complete
MKKLKIEGEGFKPFEIEVKEPNLDEREELNALLYKMFNDKNGMFGPSINIIRMMTKLTDDDINNYSNDQIFLIAMTISNFVNKKKLK